MSDWIGGDRFLNLQQQIHNAQIVVNYLSGLGWSNAAILGTIVNMSAESTINPQIWERLPEGETRPPGYGLVQWTPYTNLTNWCTAQGLDYTDGDSQLLRINYEAQNGLQWGGNIYLPDPAMPDYIGNPGITFAQYTQLDDAVYATRAWLAWYERPGYSGMLQRYLAAPTDVASWRRYLNFPDEDIKPMPIWMYIKRRWF